MQRRTRSALGIIAIAGSVFVIGASPGVAATCTTTVTKGVQVWRSDHYTGTSGSMTIVTATLTRTKDASGKVISQATTADLDYIVYDYEFRYSATSATLKMPNSLASASLVAVIPSCTPPPNCRTANVDVLWTGKADILVTHPDANTTQWSRRASAEVRSGLYGDPVPHLGRVLTRTERTVCV